MIKSEQVRNAYINKVSTLDPSDPKGEQKTKLKAREKSPAVMKAVAEEIRPISGEASRAAGTASKTNAGVNATVENLGNVGKIAGVASVGIAVYNVSTAENKPQAAAEKEGLW